jgi:hypothetical protein
MSSWANSIYNYGNSYEQTPSKPGASSFLGGVERHAVTDAAKGVGKLLGSFKKGGRVKKTGKYKLHKGERVVPRSRVKDLAKNLKF